MRFDPAVIALESTTAAAFEDGVLDALARSVGFDVAFFASSLGAPRTRGLDAGRIATALARPDLYFDEMLPTKRTALGARGVAVDTDVLGERAVRELRYHRDLAAPVGGRHSLVAYLVLRGEPLGVIMLGRCGGSFSAREVRLVEDALPSVTVARASYGPLRDDSLAAPMREVASKPLQKLLSVATGERTLERVARDDGALVVRDRRGWREMIASRDGGDMIWTRASLEDASRSGWPYVDLMLLAPTLARRCRRALFVGCGGAVAVRRLALLHPGVAIDVAEIDPAVVALARRWFGLDEVPNVVVQVADGVELVAHARARWDVAMVDAYDTADLAPGVAAHGFFARMRDALAPGGAAAVNVVGPLAGPGATRDVCRAMRASFDDVRVLPVVTPDEDFSPHAARNVVFVGVRRN